MERKSAFTFRVHQEVSGNSGDKFTLPISPTSAPDLKTFLARVPLISERDIKVAVPFKAADGTNGAMLKLSPHGRLSLDVASSESRGKLFFLFANGRQLTDVYVDSRVSDGIFIIPRGLTDVEATLLTQKYGPPRKRNKDSKPKKEKPEETTADVVSRNLGQ